MDWLAEMLSMIEIGFPWPQQLLMARAVYFSKVEGTSMRPLEFRVLTIASHVYRRWAAARLHDLEGWIQTWTDEAMHGGLKGRSAGAASYIQAVQVEMAKVQHQDLSTIAIDIHKCFDQLPRELIKAVLLEMGAPPELVTPWWNFMQHLC